MITPSTDRLLQNLIPPPNQLVKDSTVFQILFMVFQQTANKGLIQWSLEIDEIKTKLNEERDFSTKEELLKQSIEYYDELLSPTGLRSLIDFLHQPLPSTYSKITWFWELYTEDFWQQEISFFLRFLINRVFRGIWRTYQLNIESYNLMQFTKEFHQKHFLKFFLRCFLGKKVKTNASENISRLYYLIGIHYSIPDLKQRYWNIKEYNESVALEQHKLTQIGQNTTSQVDSNTREIDTYARHATLALNYIFRYLEVEDNKSAKTRFSVALKNKIPRERPQDEKEYKMWTSLGEGLSSVGDMNKAKKYLLDLSTFENKIQGEKMKAILDLVEKDIKEKEEKQKKGQNS